MNLLMSYLDRKPVDLRRNKDVYSYYEFQKLGSQSRVKDGFWKEVSYKFL